MKSDIQVFRSKKKHKPAKIVILGVDHAKPLECRIEGVGVKIGCVSELNSGINTEISFVSGFNSEINIEIDDLFDFYSGITLKSCVNNNYLEITLARVFQSHKLLL